MTKTINRAMDSGEDGVTVKWENPGTPNSGTSRQPRIRRDAPGCRMAQIENRHGTLQNSGTYILCKNQDKTHCQARPGKWSAPGWAADREEPS